MKPIDKIPEELLNEFTMNGFIPVEYKYDDATDVEVQKSINEKFNLSEFKTCIDKVLKYESNYYGDTDQFLYLALRDFPIFNQDVALIGSTYPWYEAMLLTRVPKSVTVIEYSDRKLEGIPNLQYGKPDDFYSFTKYDAAVSISSYEHDGLGRYGDPLNPNGDLEAMKTLKYIVKPGGLLYLSVPIGQDKLYFNLHRIYGKYRFPKLIEGWQPVGWFGFVDQSWTFDNQGDYQPVVVLKNV